MKHMMQEAVQIDTILESGNAVGNELIRRQRQFELILLAAVMGIMGLFHKAPDFKMVILNVYFLPVALSAFYLGRYRAGVLTCLCVLSATFTTIIDLTAPNAVLPPLLNTMTLIVWGLVLGTVAFVIGGLSDERSKQFEALHESHKTGVLSDALTGVANRRAFEYELTRRISEANDRSHPVSLVLVDIDHFKKFNDTYGHRAGDAVLRDVANTLQGQMRESDLVARFGGEEFAIILPATYATEAIDVGDRARKTIESSCYRFEGLALRLTVSVGVSQLTPGDDGAAILERADAALYASKHAGRNCTHYHDGKSCEHIGVPPEGPGLTRPLLDGGTSDIYTDELTGLPRAQVLTRELKRRVEEARRYDTPLTLMIVQVDDFTSIQKLGQQVEKKIISILSETIDAVLRSSDLIARFHADQLGVLMPSTRIDAAVTPAKRIQSFVSAQNTEALPTRLTVSIGIAEWNSSDSAETLVERVAEALSQPTSPSGQSIHVHDGQKVIPGKCGSDAFPVVDLPVDPAALTEPSNSTVQ